MSGHAFWCGSMSLSSNCGAVQALVCAQDATLDDLEICIGDLHPVRLACLTKPSCRSRLWKGSPTSPCGRFSLSTSYTPLGLGPVADLPQMRGQCLIGSGELLVADNQGNEGRIGHCAVGTAIPGSADEDSEDGAQHADRLVRWHGNHREGHIR